MYNAHLQIQAFGYHEAWERAETKEHRQAIEIAHNILAEAEFNIGLAHSGFALTTLPYRRPSDQVWIKRGHNIVLTVQSGVDHEGNEIGVPFGSVARLILIYLQTRAVQQRSPTVELGRSMRAWMSRMGMADGGENYRSIANQCERISSCSLAFHYDVENAAKPPRRNARFVEDYLPAPSVRMQDPRQTALWSDTVTLDRRFYEEIIEHSLPFRDEAIKLLCHNSLAIDIYIWLTYRLKELKKPTFIPWSGLHQQFGNHYKRVRDFKVRFRHAMSLVLAAYEEAHVNEEEGGILLYPSKPPVPERERRRRVR